MEDNNKKVQEKVQDVGTETTSQEQATPTVDYEKLYRDAVANEKKERKYAQDLKAKLESRMTEEEKTKALLEEKENRYKEIERENKLIKIKSELSKSIGDEEYLDEVATLLIDGDVANAVSKINSHITSQREDYEKQLKEAKLTNNPTPPAGNATAPAKDWKTMSTEDWNTLKETNPIEYKKLLDKIK